jgi:hypothetical protein
MASQAALEEHPSGCKLPPGYASLLDRFIEVVGGDPRVRAAWVHGSVARGDADEVSDLDVIIAVADDDIPAFAAGWRDRLDEVTPGDGPAIARYDRELANHHPGMPAVRPVGGAGVACGFFPSP